MTLNRVSTIMAIIIIIFFMIMNFIPWACPLNGCVRVCVVRQYSLSL